MDNEIKSAWTTALRSGYYKQGKNALNRESDGGGREYCCLGVLCELAVTAGAATIIGDLGAPRVYYGALNGRDADASTLPESVALWAGLTMRNPEITGLGGNQSLAGMNDDGTSFAALADLIDKYL